MALEEKLKKLIEEEAVKLQTRYHSYHNALELEHARKQRRTSSVSAKVLKTPATWQDNDLFNPFHVYKRRRQIAKSIALKITQGTYSPNPPNVKNIPKASGGYRQVTTYQIPDAAVSRLYYQQLLWKNKHRFSSFSYAYRNDRNVHFAIQDIAVELRQNSRSFIAEFDFSKFFDSINHEYLFDQFAENGFFVTEAEKKVIEAFLGPSGKGIPQGTSISLFLANLVCWKLDKGLEKAGLQFARYADDTVIWSQDYQKISRAYDIISAFSKEAGVAINVKKSDGISLLCSKDMPSEFVSKKEYIEFLGYSVSVSNVGIKERSVNKIKKQISYILYKHLLQPLGGTQLTALVIPANNKDTALLSAIQEVRRYLYGNLTEEMIRNYLNGNSNRIFFKGIMSFYPLVDNEDQLKELDGWLVSTIYKTIQKRAKLLKKWKFNRDHIFPFNVKRNQLTVEFKRKRINGNRLLQIPSFFNIYRALKKGLQEVGVEGVMNASSLDYDY
ncbi:reverse transcriptase domain-containing protein [Methylophilus sp. 'Pure River']|uniref:reverse transcriptase domain-containing protein n=1 Tax=Methylophilus sp. 'Pure River' TaxID=3377117 RepID=UPI00398E6849